MQDRQIKVFRFNSAVGSDLIAIRNNGKSGNVFWSVNENGSVDYAASATVQDFNFKLIPADEILNSIHQVEDKGGVKRTEFYNLNGIRLAQPQRGINIRKTTYENGCIITEKILVKN